MKVREGLGPFWSGITASEIDLIWHHYKQNNENIVSCFDFGDSHSEVEDRIIQYLGRFLRNADGEILRLMLQFCTGSSTIDLVHLIKVMFVNQDPRHLALQAKACFKILYLPKQVASYKMFKTMCTSTLTNDALWSMHDDDD